MNHEDAAVWTILGTVPAPNPQIRYDKHFPMGVSLNCVPRRTIAHAHRIFAMATCHRYEQAAEDCPFSPIQPGFSFMCPRTGFHALITAYAFVFIDEQDICTFEDTRIHQSINQMVIP